MYVNSTIAISGDGESWSNAFGKLDDALYTAWQCPSVTTILVEKGTYIPSRKPYNMDINKKGIEVVTSDDRDRTFHIRPGLDIRGGYSGGVQNIPNNPTILSGLIGTSINAYHTVVIDSSINWAITGSLSQISGFVIKDANANGTGSVTVNATTMNQNSGAGVCVLSGSSVLENNTISNNVATSSGAGIALYNSSNNVKNNTLTTNLSADLGGGIYTNNANNSLYNNVIASNTATNTGGGVYVFSGSNNIVNNTIHKNTATNAGGGLYLSTGINSLSNTVFWENKLGAISNVSGADFSNNTATNTLKNCLLQLPNTNYTNTGSGNYDLGVNAAANVFGINPVFLNPNNIAGADNLHRTADDGLQISAYGLLINKGDHGFFTNVML